MPSKAERPSPDPAEEPLLWEGLTLNKCILVASVVALLSVTFQVLQGEWGVGRSGKGWPGRAVTPCPLLSPPVLQRHAPRRDSPAAARSLRPLPFPVGPTFHPLPDPRALRAPGWDVPPEQPQLTVACPCPLTEAVSPKVEIPEAVTAQPAPPPESSAVEEEEEEDEDGDDDDDSEADSNLVRARVAPAGAGSSLSPERGVLVPWAASPVLVPSVPTGRTLDLQEVVWPCNTRG